MNEIDEMACEYQGCERKATIVLRNGHNTIHCCDQCAPAWVHGGKSDMQKRAESIGLSIKNSYTVSTTKIESKEG